MGCWSRERMRHKCRCWTGKTLSFNRRRCKNWDRILQRFPASPQPSWIVIPRASVRYRRRLCFSLRPANWSVQPSCKLTQSSSNLHLKLSRRAATATGLRWRRKETRSSWVVSLATVACYTTEEVFRWAVMGQTSLAMARAAPLS